MLSYETILKNKLVEGNFQDDLYKTISNFKDEEEKMNLPLGKIEKILEKMLEKFSGTKMTDDNKCQGEFYINKLTNKECGEGFNERLYKIIDEGDGNCLHSELYKEKVPLPSCKFNEKCDSDLDCESNNCSEGTCIDKLDCNENMLSGCNRRSCLELNSGLDRDIYYYQDNECNVDPCNEQNYRMCDEGGCNSLSYRYKFNNTRGICEQIVQEVDDTGLRTGSYMSLISGAEDKGCNGNNPQDCSGVCSEFNPNTTESCSIGGTIDNPEPNYICKSQDNNIFYFNMDIRGTKDIHDGNNEFPCYTYNYNKVNIEHNIILNGVSLEDISEDISEDSLITYICNTDVLDFFDGHTNECKNSIEILDGSINISIKNISLDLLNRLSRIYEDIHDELNNFVPGITSLESKISIGLPNCGEDKGLVSGKCRYCSPGSEALAGICVPCPIGNYYDGGDSNRSCQPCEDGMIAESTGSISCTPCRPGTISNEENTVCVPCPSNTYSDSPGSASCTDCPLNLGSHPGSSSCQDFLQRYNVISEDRVAATLTAESNIQVSLPPLPSSPPPPPPPPPTPSSDDR